MLPKGYPGGRKRWPPDYEERWVELKCRNSSRATSKYSTHPTYRGLSAQHDTRPRGILLGVQSFVCEPSGRA
eukprot:6213948-Pleurochrysis_carterae.AAC.1